MSAWKRSRPAGRDGESGDPAEAASAERPPAAEKAAALLALRPHFRRELELKLGRAGYDREEISAALDRLVSLRLLDDAAQARSFVDTVARRKGWGRMRVAQELARRGAPEAAAEAALAGLSTDADLEAAREAARRWRAKSGGGRAASPQGRDALARHLSRRGFVSSAIFKVLKEMALQDPPSEEPSEPEE